jgi:lipopolysaccharide/colanic/teichoic acid biosynthesis glycosyltransferase
MRRWFAVIFSRENLLALALCLLVIALIIMTTSSAPQWIYQGF